MMYKSEAVRYADCSAVINLYWPLERLYHDSVLHMWFERAGKQFGMSRLWDGT